MNWAQALDYICSHVSNKYTFLACDKSHNTKLKWIKAYVVTCNLSLIIDLLKLIIELSVFVINSYGESWDSSCEKLWVKVQNQWVPVKINESEIENAWPFM